MQNTNAATPALIVITLILIAASYFVNTVVRPLFNRYVSQYKHHKMIEARRAEFYAGLGVLMNSERKSGLL